MNSYPHFTDQELDALVATSYRIAVIIKREYVRKKIFFKLEFNWSSLNIPKCLHPQRFLHVFKNSSNNLYNTTYYVPESRAKLLTHNILFIYYNNPMK